MLQAHAPEVGLVAKASSSYGFGSSQERFRESFFPERAVLAPAAGYVSARASLGKREFQVQRENSSNGNVWSELAYQEQIQAKWQELVRLLQERLGEGDAHEFLPAVLMDAGLREKEPSTSAQSAPSSARRRRKDVSAVCLTPRRQETLELLAQNLSTSEIAQRMGIAPDTVREHIKSIHRFLGISHTYEVVAVARTRGLLPPKPESV